MDLRLEDRLMEALGALERGEAPAAVLGRFPDDAEALAPLLEVARTLPTLTSQARPAAQAASRMAFLAGAEDLRARRPLPWWRRWADLRPGRPSGLLAAGMAMAVLILVAAPALPGQPLYPVKHSAESAWLSLLPAGPARDAAEGAYWRRRAVEVHALLEAGTEAQVVMQGPIEAVTADAWHVAGVEARLQPNSRVLGTPEIDEIARVWGRTQGGRLLVDTIVCEPPPGQEWVPDES